ncbi:MAG: hypothetical protein WC659_04485 [Patescibacteria group bacterium]
MTLQNYIKKKPYLVWSTKNYDGLSDATILEAVLNYGDWDDVQKVIKILGIKKAARIFREKSQQKRCNYLPKSKNYFRLYFNKYAQ